MRRYVFVILTVLTLIMSVSPTEFVFAQSEETPCSPPVTMAGNDRFLIERCDDGAWVIDTEDGSRSWVGSGEVKKVCDENGQCVQVS